MMMSSLFRKALPVLAAVAVLAGAAVTPLVAQTTGTVRGKVVESKTLRPLSGAQVLVEGTGRGGLTNAAGEFVIPGVPAGQHTVQAQMIGFATAKVPVTVTAGQATQVTLQLSVTAIAMDEIVVTGTAGAVSKRTLGNAITKVDAAAVTAKTTINSVGELLQSKSPGLTLLPNAGTPGAASEMRIRGAASFGNNAPVVYVDGVRYNTANLGQFSPSGASHTGYSAQTTSALDMLNPNDIESIEVIKGPAAATLYGADAAAGVIQIITKKGKAGQQDLQWTGRYEYGQNEWALPIPANYTLCDAAKLADPATWPGCVGKPLNTVLSSNPLREDPHALRVGDVQRASLSVRGGGTGYSFYVSGDLDDEQGVFYNSHNVRRSLRGNFSVAPSDALDLQFTSSLINTNLQLPLADESAHSLLFSAFGGQPGKARPEGHEGWYGTNPEEANAYDNRTTADRLTLGATVNYRPFSWMRHRLTLGYDFTSSKARIVSPPGSYDARAVGHPEGVVAMRYPRNWMYTADYVGSADYQLSDNLSTVTSAGMQLNFSRYEMLYAYGYGMGSPDVTDIGTLTQRYGDDAFSEQKSLGYYVQEQVGWKDRLFVTGALRADDNSAFGKGFDLIIYPKASLSWMLSEEPALRPYFEKARIDDFKLRTAWGQAGRAPDPFTADQTWTVSTAVVGDEVVSSVVTNSYGNVDLKPERGSEIEVGFEASLLGGRAGVDFTYYNKHMTDVILSTGIPASSGFTGSQYRNLGETRNTGVEMVLSATPVLTENFTWDANLTLATNSNKLISFGDPTYTVVVPWQPYATDARAQQQHRAGYPLAGYWGQLPLRNPDGTPKLNQAGTDVLLDTATYIGPSTPTREIGFSNTFTIFRNFRVYALFDYKGGFYNYSYYTLNRNGIRLNSEYTNNPANLNDPEYLVKRSVRAAHIHKADFIKLRDLSVTYNLPPEIAARLGGSAASLTLAGHNLAMWTDYPGLDPETNSYGNRPFARSEVYSVPMLRRLSMSLNFSF